jgi:hypothetical protein
MNDLDLGSVKGDDIHVLHRGRGGAYLIVKGPKKPMEKVVFGCRMEEDN